MSFWISLLAVLALAFTNAWWWSRVRRQRTEFARWREDERAREQRWRQEQERERAGQETVFNCMAEGLVWLGSEGRVRLLNQPLRRWFGVTGEVRGRSLVEVLRRHELQDLATRAVAEGQALGLELEIGDRESRVVQVNATTFGQAAGTPERGVILVFHDVTRLKQLENTRREFVANVSHELRTPLSLIKGYVETLIDGASRNPEVSLRFLQTIEKHANRLTFLIEDLLTISQLESGQISLNRQPGPARAVVARVFEDLATRAAARGVTLVSTVPEDLELRADFDRLQQVLMNLVDNAIKYGRSDGRVEVGARAVVESGNGRVELWVSDDGPGIPRDALERVFERFYRVDAARSSEQGGTGLGLSIVKHIVQAHGGEVRAESDVGKGTTFRMTLPREVPPRER